jgi:hypothetical protein
MPGFRPDNARMVRTSIVIHDFDQWTNPNNTRFPGCACMSFMPGPSQEPEA